MEVKVQNSILRAYFKQQECERQDEFEKVICIINLNGVPKTNIVQTFQFTFYDQI